MQSLTALIRETRADDPLARALEAILDSGLVIFSRDTHGHFVQLSEVLTERAGIIADTGSSQPRNLRVFDEQGRLLPGSEYPAAITRRTGTPQREILRRLVSDDDREIWLKMSTIPLERGPDGWSVLTVGTDVTDLEQARATAQSDATARGAIAALSLELATGQLNGEQCLDALGDVLGALLPHANVILAMRDGEEEYQTTPLAHGYGEASVPRRGRYTSEQRKRWAATSAHVNRDVQDTDIYGATVVVEFANAIRSIVVAPCLTADEERLGGVVAFSDRPGDFSDEQVATLELAARLVAVAIEQPQALARAS